MGTTRIWGTAHGELVLRGAIDDELTAEHGEDVVLAFSTGELVSLYHEGGQWSARVLAGSPRIEQCDSGAQIEVEDAAWVVCGREYAGAAGASSSPGRA